jgi:DNA-binding transcriptional LysR family regulator
MGIGLMPDHACRDSADGRLTHVPLLPRVDATVMIVRPRGRTMKPGASALWAHLLAASQVNPTARTKALRSVEA